jgi:hypothetical protein
MYNWRYPTELAGKLRDLYGITPADSQEIDEYLKHWYESSPDMTIQIIADELGVSYSAVNLHLRQAQTRFRPVGGRNNPTGRNGYSPGGCFEYS